MENNNIVVQEFNVGIDIFPIYQSSCYSFSVPKFEHLYDEYKIAFLQKETNLTGEQIKGQLELVNQGYYQPFELGVEPLLEVRPEPEFFYYLIENSYSFSLKKKHYHVPFQEVW